MENYTVPPILPTFSSAMNHGWETMKRDFLRLFLVILVIMITTWPLALLPDHHDPHTAGAVILSIIGMAYFLLVVPVFHYSATYLFLQSVRREKIDVKNIIRGFERYLDVVLASLLTIALIALGFVALVIPGIIVGCRLAFVPFLVMDKGLDPVSAVEESWRKTRGFGWTIFGMAVVSFFIVIAGIICLIVGVFPAVIWVKAAFASLYEAVNLTVTPNGIEQGAPVA